MRAGRLRQRVTLQSKVAVQNDSGEEVITWTDVATVWASVEPLRGREFVEARRAGAEETTRIVMRYRDGVTPEMRVTWGDHDYDILSVVHVDTRQREIQLMCRELV